MANDALDKLNHDPAIRNAARRLLLRAIELVDEAFPWLTAEDKDILAQRLIILTTRTIGLDSLDPRSRAIFCAGLSVGFTLSKEAQP